METPGFVKIWATSENDAIWVPYPDAESGLQTKATSVNGAFNGNNVFIGQKVGRDRGKIEMNWKRMDAAVWRDILALFSAHFVIRITYYDMADGIVTRSFYVSDRTARPGEFMEDGLTWKTAVDCKFSLIDTGKGA